MGRAGNLYASKRWRRFRRQKLDSVNWRCERCGSYGNEVHHNHPIAEGGAFWVRLDQVTVLCRRCHAAETMLQLRRADPLVDERQRWQEWIDEIE